MWLFASIGEYPVYDEVVYDAMIKDERRMGAHHDAVRRYAPGRTVLDIGTGQDAVWALAAARAGARHVWAVEVIPESARIAREKIKKGATSRSTRCSSRAVGPRSTPRCPRRACRCGRATGSSSSSPRR